MVIKKVNKDKYIRSNFALINSDQRKTYKQDFMLFLKRQADNTSQMTDSKFDYEN